MAAIIPRPYIGRHGAVLLTLVALSLLPLPSARAQDDPGKGTPDGRQHARVFPKTPTPAQTILHVDLLKAPDDLRLALTVLQGLVNREQPCVYISQNPGWHGPALIPKWIEGLKARGHSFEEVRDPFSLFDRFQARIKGAVVYETDLWARPEALHKINALTLFCAVNDAIPLSEALYRKLRPLILFDARGRLSTAEEAYGWAYTRLWRRANRRALALTCPSHIVLRDYLVAHRIFPFWISRGMSSGARDLCLRFLEESEPNTPLLGCWGGYGEQPPGAITEPELQRVASERGKFIVVTDGCFNLSLHAGLEFRGAQRPLGAAGVPLNPNVVYVCLNFTDGDNLQYIQQYFGTRQWWGDPNRGRIPLSWSMNPVAAELMPDVLEHFLSTRTPNDEFVCSTAGVGVAVPSLYGVRCANAARLYDSYLQTTVAAMQRVGFVAVHVGDTSGIPWAPADFSRWAGSVPGLDGILADYGPAPGVSPINAAFTTWQC